LKSISSPFQEILLDRRTLLDRRSSPFQEILLDRRTLLDRRSSLTGEPSSTEGPPWQENFRRRERRRQRGSAVGVMTPWP
jgi:hypothetical protein